MNSIFYMGSRAEKLDAQTCLQNKEVQQMIEEYKNGSILAYLKLLDTCTPVAFYKIMNEPIEKNGKWIKLKDLKGVDKQKILLYSSLILEENEFTYRILYEYRQVEEDIIRYYKRNQTMFALINEAILKQDVDFLESVAPYLQHFPCYDWWTKEKGFSKSLKKC